MTTPETAQLLVGQLGVRHGPKRLAQLPCPGHHFWRDPPLLGHGSPRRLQGCHQKTVAVKTVTHEGYKQRPSQVATAVGTNALDRVAGLDPGQGRTPQRIQLGERQGHQASGGVAGNSSRIMPEPTRARRASSRPRPSRRRKSS